MPSHSQEVFYLHINGEQRGPYTVRHIDHLLNSGLINEDALFWREGLEQWQPVTDLVTRRTPRKRWKRNTIIFSIAAVLALILLRLFLPITLDGWREINQRDFTERAAYWRARGFVRSQCVPRGAIVSFGPMPDAKVELRSDDTARVTLHGELTLTQSPTRTAAWRVDLHYDRSRAEWSGTGAREVPVR
ncbi:MAG TPA: DUF4339 domain-containing protein [Chthoniobacteraceae bacterium]|nr:DUF4339 domain-containing protein [Chthoniobacteraceae bacterium]